MSMRRSSSSSNSLRKIDSFSIALYRAVQQQNSLVLFESSQQRFGLEQGFRPLLVRVRQRDDGASNANAHRILRENRSSDDNVQVRAAAERQEADRSRVDAAGATLQFVDDLHRPDLRRARHGAAWKGALEAIDGSTLRGQFSAHGGHQLVNCRVRFHVHELRHMYGAHRADPPQIVSQQVHDHQVLGTAFLVFRQGTPQKLVFSRSKGAGARALNRLRFDDGAAIDFEESLRRGAGDGQLGEFKKRRVRRGISKPQPLVVFESVNGGSGGHLIGETNLIRFTLSYRMERAVDVVEILALGVDGRETNGLGCILALAKRRYRSGNPELDLVKPGGGFGFGFGVANENKVHLIGEVIDGDKLRGHQRQAVRVLRPMHSGSAAYRLQFVSEVAEKTAVEIEWHIRSRDLDGSEASIEVWKQIFACQFLNTAAPNAEPAIVSMVADALHLAGVMAA